GIRLWIMLRDQIDYAEFCRRGLARQSYARCSCGSARVGVGPRARVTETLIGRPASLTWREFARCHHGPLVTDEMFGADTVVMQRHGSSAERGHRTLRRQSN